MAKQPPPFSWSSPERPSACQPEVATPVANRHYAATVPNGGKVSLTFAEGFCVYVVYLTSEPASLEDFGGD